VQSMAGRFMDGLQVVGDSLSKISTNCMKYGYVVFYYMSMLQFYHICDYDCLCAHG
jgi:hypothetical protein